MSPTFQSTHGIIIEIMLPILSTAVVVVVEPVALLYITALTKDGIHKMTKTITIYTPVHTMQTQTYPKMIYPSVLLDSRILQPLTEILRYLNQTKGKHCTPLRKLCAE